MRTRNISGTLVMAAIVFVLSAPAMSAGVKDDGKFFSAETVQKANSAISEIRNKYHKDVVVETFPSIPENKKSSYSPEKKNQFFAEWLRERAHDQKVDGIFILITREPAHLQVGVGSQTVREGFSGDDRDRVRNLLLDFFKKKQYDEGLLQGLALISSTIDENRKTFHTAAPNAEATPSAGRSQTPVNPPIASQQGSHFGWLPLLLILVVGFLILRGLIGAFRRATYGPGPGPGLGGYGPGGGGGGGGGGFLSSLLGGMAGGAAGGWAASHWFGNNPQTGTPGAAPPPMQDEGRGIESTGGDFGPPDSSSGGDFGGPADTGSGGSGGDSGGSGGGDF